MSLIEIIKQARIDKGYTMTEFAEKVGIDAPHYSRIERGEIMPRLGLIERMLIELDISVTKHKTKFE